MTPSPDEVKELLEQLRNGNEAAEGKLLEMLGPWIRRLIRKKLDSRVRRWADSEDILQNLAMDLLDVVGRKKGFQNGRQFLTYVAEAAKNRALNANRDYLQSYKGRAERNRESLDGANEPYCSVDGPAEQAQAKDTLEQMMSKAREPARTVLSMRVTGHSNRDIATAAHIDERTVRKIVEQLRKTHARSRHEDRPQS